MDTNLLIPKMATDRYQGQKDDPNFDKLIAIGCVNVSGQPIVDSSLLIQPTGLNDITYVASGSGYYDVWRSNAQKMVRRSDEKGALKSLYEIITTTLVTDNPAFASNILNRFFQVMVSEDIGWAQPQLPSLASSLLLRYYKNKDLIKDPSFRTEIIHGVQIMARGKKSRYVDYLCHLAQVKAKDLLRNIKQNIPYESLLETLQNPESSFLGRIVILYLLHHSSQQVTQSSFSDKRLNRKRKVVFIAWQYLLDTATSRLQGEINALLDLYLLPGGESLLSLIHAFILIDAEVKNKLVWSPLPEINQSPTWEEIGTWLISPSAVAYDKHTQVGRQLGRDNAWFYRYGGKITNCVPEYEEEELGALALVLS